MKQSKPTGTRWQLTIADPNALHPHGGSDLRGEWACEKLNDLDRWVKKNAPAHFYVEWVERMKALMGVMVIGQEWTDEDDEEGLPPDCGSRHCSSLH